MASTFPENFTALVTGGGGGLGRALALELAKRGGRVVVADINAKAAEETVELLTAISCEAVAIACDVSKIADFERAIELANTRYGHIDVLVNNAGVAVSGPVGVIPIEDWSYIISVNLLGVIHGCHLLAPKMRALGRGWILNIASAAGLVCASEMGPYNVTKAGVVALSETLTQEMAPFGVHVTVLCPTFFKTGIIDNARHHGEKKIIALASRRSGESKLQAPEVARFAIDKLLKGQLYAVPMSDGLWMWRIKRLAPAFFYRAMSPRIKRWVVDKLP
jgi:NAD(P)-dependent dehydrogenase (short-subunit alcohol dehydrogenase family)